MTNSTTQGCKAEFVWCAARRPQERVRRAAKWVLLLLATLVSWPDEAMAIALTRGDILVTDLEVGTVIKIDPDTGEQAFVLPPISLPGGLPSAPLHVAIDSNGEILVTVNSGFGSGNVIRIDPTNETWMIDTDLSNALTGIPLGIAVDRNNGFIFLSHEDSGIPVVTRYDPVTGDHPGFSGGIFEGVAGLDVAPDGTAFAAGLIDGSPPGALFRLNFDTGIRTTFASGGNLTSPRDAVIEQNGDILVVDGSSVFDPTFGGVIRIDGDFATQTVVSQGNQFVNTIAIDVGPNGYIFVLDRGAHAVFRVAPISGTQTVVSQDGFLVVPNAIAVVPGPSVPGFSIYPEEVFVPAWVEKLGEQLEDVTARLRENIETAWNSDEDDDGVVNFRDDCDTTVPGEPVNKHGCSAADLGGPIAVFDFDDGTVQGFTDVFFPMPNPANHSDLQFPLTDPVQSGSLLGSAETGPDTVIGGDPEKPRVYSGGFFSPDLSLDPQWQNIDGFQASVRAGPSSADVSFEVIFSMNVRLSDGTFAGLDEMGSPEHFLSPDEWRSFTARFNVPDNATVERLVISFAAVDDPPYTTEAVRFNLDLVHPVRDTDGDGVEDNREPVFCALTDDCDNDLVRDGIFAFGSEDFNGNGVWEPEFGETDPTNPDTDGDGLSDGEETDPTQALNTNPLDPDTDEDSVDDGADNCTNIPNPDQLDSNGNGVGDACDDTATYDFTGFFPPVDNLPILNRVKAGSAVPIKFSLNGDQGLDIFAETPSSQLIACDTSTPLNGTEETVTAGKSSLSYDTLTDQYVYVWKTDKAWAGSCRELIIRLLDGSEHQAIFQFK